MIISNFTEVDRKIWSLVSDSRPSLLVAETYFLFLSLNESITQKITVTTASYTYSPKYRVWPEFIYIKMFTLYWKLYVFKVPYQYLQNLVRRDESAPVEWIVRCCWKFQVASTFNTHFELQAELIFSKYCFILFFDLKRKENKNMKNRKWIWIKIFHKITTIVTPYHEL